MNQCKSCGAPIRWVKTLAGKAMPIDAEPVADGNIVVNEHGQAEVIGPVPSIPGPRYKSHFATCVNAAKHRKPKGQP